MPVFVRSRRLIHRAARRLRHVSTQAITEPIATQTTSVRSPAESRTSRGDSAAACCPGSP
jgi:hypothetical protein